MDGIATDWTEKPVKSPFYRGFKVILGFLWDVLVDKLPLWGARGRVFESLRPDQITPRLRPVQR